MAPKRSADHPIVTEEAWWAATNAVGKHHKEARKSEEFSYASCAKAALDAAAPLIQKQVEERVRERLLSKKVVKAAAERAENVYGDWNARYLEPIIERGIEAALDFLDQDPEQ